MTLNVRAPAEVSTQPTVTIQTANSSVTLGSNFTITMVDADVVGTDESNGQTRHWLVNGVGLKGSKFRSPATAL